jgi:hypothetical protein
MRWVADCLDTAVSGPLRTLSESGLLGTGGGASPAGGMAAGEDAGSQGADYSWSRARDSAACGQAQG